MANPKLTVEIGAIITEFEAAMKQVEASSKKVVKDLENIGTGSANSAVDTKKLTNSLEGLNRGLGGAYEVMDQFSRSLLGVNTNFTGTGRAVRGATAGIKGFKSALIATGIGAFVVIAGELIANWDKIEVLFSKSARALKKLNDEHERLQGSLNVDKAKLGNIKAQIALNKELGKSNANNLEDEKDLYNDLLNTQTKQLETLKDAWSNVYDEARGGKTGSAIKFSDKELEKISQAETAYYNKKRAINETELAILKVGKSTEGLTAKELEALAKAEAARQKHLTKIGILSYNASKKLEQERIKSAGRDRQIIREGYAEEEAIIQQAEDDKINEAYRRTLEAYGIKKLGADKEKELYKSYVGSSMTDIIAFSEWKRTQEGIDAEAAIRAAKKKNDELLDVQKAYEARMKQFAESVNAAFSGAVTSMITGMADMIGALVAGGGGMENAGAAILKMLGGIISQFGSAIIAAGVAALALEFAISNPATAILAGAALVAMGAAMGAAADSLSSVNSESGGGSSSRSDYSSSSYGSSSTISGGGGGTYVFEISGTKLIGVLKNTMDRNRALGGTISLT